MGYSQDMSDIVDGRRHLILVLLDRHGKELDRKAFSFEFESPTENEHRAFEHGVAIKAIEAYRRAFWDYSEKPKD